MIIDKTLFVRGRIESGIKCYPALNKEFYEYLEYIKLKGGIRK